MDASERACPLCRQPADAADQFCSGCGAMLPPFGASAPTAAAKVRTRLRSLAPPASSPVSARPSRWSRWRRWGPTISPDSLLALPRFRALLLTRLSTEAALNALTYGMLIVIVRQHEESRWVGLLAALVTVSTVAPAALFGPLGGVVVDRVAKHRALIVTSLVRAALCFSFLFFSDATLNIYLLLAAITVVTQFATPAESSVLPLVVPRLRLAAANSYANLAESIGQVLGMAALAPIMVKLPGAPRSLILVSGLLLTFAAARAVALGFVDQPASPPPPERLPATVAKPWLSGTRAALTESWRWLAGDRPAFIAMMLLVLASTANLVMVTLAPKFTQEVIGLEPEYAIFVFAPAVIGITLGLLVVPRLAQRVAKRLLVTIGFLVMVAVLLALGSLDGVTALARELDPLGLVSGPLSWGWFGRAEGRLGMALLLAAPLGFAFTAVQVSAHTLLHERVPLAMQGRVFALQGAVKNATAIAPLLALGLLASLIDVRIVIVLASLLLLFLALYGAAHSEQWTAPRPAPTPSDEAAPEAG